MNARTKQLFLTVDTRQLHDAASCIFHTLLLHRTMGKFHYQNELNYKTGSVGLQEVTCSEIDLSYVRVNSPELCLDVEQRVNLIDDAVRSACRVGGFVVGSSPKSSGSSPSPSVRQYGIDKLESLITAPVRLEFYQKRKRQWAVFQEFTPWEIWDVNFDVVRTVSNTDYDRMQQYVGEKLSDICLNIVQLMNKNQYKPAIPDRSNISEVFEDRFPDCEPYLYRIESDLIPKATDLNSRSSIFMRVFRDTMKFNA